MYKSINGSFIKAPKRFPHWNSIVENWFEIHDIYVAKTKDVAYWYTERTNVGILAQAAWKSELIALEEYQTKKMARHDPTASSNGRCDLWISRNNGSDVIEAKQTYIKLGSKRNTAVANSYLKKSLDDAKRTVGDSGEDAIGLAFLLGYFPAANIDPTEIAGKIELSIELVKASNADVIAWCFPGRARVVKGQSQTNYIPGLFMIASSI